MSASSDAGNGGGSAGGDGRKASRFTPSLPSDVGAIWRRAAYTLGVLPVVLAAGSAAFMLVEGWRFSDALYQTAMTLSTVGYREVHPFSEGGRVVSYAVMFSGVLWLALWFAVVTSFIIESDVFHLFRHRRLEREISNLENHYIVCGVGRTGTQVIAEFLRGGAPYVALDVDPERVALLRREAPHLRVVEGDTTRDEVLARVRVGAARGLVAALSNDTDNLFVTLTARALNPNLKIVARVNNDDNVGKMMRAGADHVVSPQRIGGARMAALLLRPGVMSLLDVVTRGGGVTLSIEELTVESGSRLAGSTLGELEIGQRTGALVVAIKKNASGALPPFLFNPGSATRVDVEDTLIAMGEPGQLEALRRLTVGETSG